MRGDPAVQVARSLAIQVALALASAACASAPPGSSPAPAVLPEDLLVWDASAGVTAWVRDGEVVARRAEVVVAVGDTLVALRMLPRMLTVFSGTCVDGCEHCDDPDWQPPPPSPPDHVVIDELFAVPLEGDTPRLLATQSRGQDASCGLPGEAPRLIGGLGARVSVVWVDGELQSGVGGDVVTPRGAVFDLAAGVTVALTAPEGFLEIARQELALVCDDPADYGCEGAREGAVIAGPLALRVGCDADDYGGEHELRLTALATRDWDGDFEDGSVEIPVANTLGLGEVPMAVLRAVVVAFGSSDAFGFSRVAGDAAGRAHLEAIFRRPVPPVPAPTLPSD